ncbi:protein HEXIM1-like [Formica exsecta]|uniref:protein HEXIM1-like n=1 Tax=Formica exsecta TaxID=72781 RepID=UPI001144B2FB|nr:protein HEXIM1-like [Formica exsecta]
METCEAETTTEKTSGGVGADSGVHDAKGVMYSAKAEPTPAASSRPLFERVPRSVGESAEREANVDRSNGNKYKTSLIKNYGRLESGSGSGDQDGGQHEDTAAKKRKTRRGKPKHRKLKPYLKQLSYQQQLRSRCIGRIAKTNRQPPALYNTTQFLMNDHSDLPDLEQKLSEATSLEVPAMFQKPPAPPRTRDSSFSVDSDEDYFYSSPEDEEEFLTKEFSTAYEDLHEERLSTLTKTELIQEYRHLEAKMDSLTKRLRNKSIHQIEERDSENKNVSTTDSEIAKKLKLCQQRIDDLIQQNEQLRRENEMLRTEKRLCASSSESSVDSESDSDSSSNSNQSRCSCSFSSPGTSPKHTYKSRLDNNIRTDKKNDSCDTSRSGSPRTSITPTNFSNRHMVMNETGSFPT